MSESEICAICRDIIKTEEKGVLDCCTHVYCSECIGISVKHSSTCPQCRKEIKTITTNGGVKHVEPKKRCSGDDMPHLSSGDVRRSSDVLENMLTSIMFTRPLSLEEKLRTLVNRKREGEDRLNFMLYKIEEVRRHLQENERDIDEIKKQINEKDNEKAQPTSDRRSCRNCGDPNCPGTFILDLMKYESKSFIEKNEQI